MLFMRIAKTALAGAMLLTLLSGANAFTQERKAYRHVDAAGNVTYSQMPPVNAKESKSIDISPAQRGRGGDTSGYSVYDNPHSYSERHDRYYGTTPRQGTHAYEQRMAELRVECLRQRGADCNNPATLRYLDSTHSPGQVRRPVQRPPHLPRRDG